MASICGFSASALATDDAVRTGRAMYDALSQPADIVQSGDPRQSAGDCHPAGGVWTSAGRNVDRHADPAGLLLTAIEGEPRWRDPALAAVAAESGHAAALARAYSEHGPGLLERLTGGFALVVNDLRRHSVMLAVDRMGIRPLCYATTADGGLAFATTTTTLLAHPGVDDTLSHQAIYDYVYFHVIPSPGTIFSAIGKLEPAQCLVFADGRVDLRHYWTPSFQRPEGPPAQEMEQALMRCMREAVERSGPGGDTGCFLSGGLDSSTVCGLASAVAADNGGAPVKAFSIGFDQEGYDEIEFARTAAARFGLDLTEYYVTPDDVADAIGVIATSYDEPFGNSSAIPAYFCARRATEHGIHRLLAGDGGDELFAGNERYARQRIFEHYGRVPGWLRRGVLEPVFLSRLADATPVTRKLGRYIEQARVPLPARLETYNLLHVRAPGEVFDPAFLATVRPAAPVENMGRWYARAGEADLVDRMLHYDWKLTLADNDLRKVNRMCEVAGVAVAYPLLDDDLVAFSTTIPSELKLKGNQLRWFFKRAVRDFLPATIINKTKHGFGLPFGEWAATPGRLQDHVMASLAGLQKRNILHPDFISQLVASHRTEHAAYYGNFLWVLAMLEDWLAARESRG